MDWYLGMPYFIAYRACYLSLHPILMLFADHLHTILEPCSAALPSLYGKVTPSAHTNNVIPVRACKPTPTATSTAPVGPLPHSPALLRARPCAPQVLFKP